MDQRDFLLENSLGENAGEIERVKKIEVYAEIQGTNVYLNSRVIDMYSSISIISCVSF